MAREGTSDIDDLVTRIHSLQACDALAEKRKEKDSLSKLCTLMKSKYTRINRENAQTLPSVRANIGPGVYQGVVVSHTRTKFRVSFVVEFKHGTDHAWLDDGFRNVYQTASCICGRNQPVDKRRRTLSCCTKYCTANCSCRKMGRTCNKNCFCESKLCCAEDFGDNVVV